MCRIIRFLKDSDKGDYVRRKTRNLLFSADMENIKNMIKTREQNPNGIFVFLM